jgi:hypothetical protein
MTRTRNHRSFAFVSSTFGATLVSIVAAWTVSSVILEPIAPRDPNAVHLKSNGLEAPLSHLPHSARRRLDHLT